MTYLINSIIIKVYQTKETKMAKTNYFLTKNEAKYLMDLMKNQDYINQGKGATFAKLEIIAKD